MSLRVEKSTRKQILFSGYPVSDKIIEVDVPYKSVIKGDNDEIIMEIMAEQELNGEFIAEMVTAFLNYLEKRL